MKVILDGNSLTVQDVVSVARFGAVVELSPGVIQPMKASRDIVEETVRTGKVVYGINTGFGKFSDVSISEEDSKQLQLNLIMSHACGVGEPFSGEVVRAMMVLRLNALVVGNSGISTSTANTLLSIINSKVVPYIPSQGSLGASGDLAPLAHMAMCMIGLGQAYYDGQLMTAEQALAKAGIKKCQLTAKEGLALINGTQAMNANATLSIHDSFMLSSSADIIASMTLQALRAIIDAFDLRVHTIRKQSGQINTAKNILSLLSHSKLTTKQGELRVQDAYTLRCIPQIHGATKDALNYIDTIIANEVNAVTDNPLIFADDGHTISGGNFHGQYLSMALDFLGISMSEIANVSERRTERMVNPQLSNGLQAFLVKNGGLNSGFMIPQYVAAALVSENKVLAHPAVVDSITSSANQEDHVSMGMTAALKARRIINNVTNVLAIELLTACQAIELSDNVEKLSPCTRAVFELVRSRVPFVNEDMYMSPLINQTAQIVSSGELVEVVEAIIGKLLK